MFKGISKGTKRLHEIMDSMFDIAQIDSRTLQIHLTPVDISILIKDVGRSLEKTFQERKQTLNMDIQPRPQVKADPNLLKKLFQHLLTNAIKFTPNEGKVTITAKTVMHNTDIPDGAVQITVSDTGVGVDPDSREVIFSKFYQPGELSNHSTSNTRFKIRGSGFRVTICQ